MGVIEEYICFDNRPNKYHSNRYRLKLFMVCLLLSVVSLSALLVFGNIDFSWRIIFFINLPLIIVKSLFEYNQTLSMSIYEWMVLKRRFNTSQRIYLYKQER